jgi:hypothetical protein
MDDNVIQGPESPDRSMPYGTALTAVVRGLYKDPILLFGIGAGILVVGALAFTSSVALVLAIAGLFIVVLAARIHMQTRRVRSGRALGIALGSSLDETDVGTADSDKGRATGFVLFSRAKNSRIGAAGGERHRRPPEP